MGGVKACRKSFVFFWERKSCRIRPVFGLFWQSEGLEICSTLPIHSLKGDRRSGFWRQEWVPFKPTVGPSPPKGQRSGAIRKGGSTANPIPKMRRNKLATNLLHHLTRNSQSMAPATLITDQVPGFSWISLNEAIRVSPTRNQAIGARTSRPPEPTNLQMTRLVPSPAMIASNEAFHQTVS